MNGTQFKDKKRCLHYKTYCILLRVTIFKTILVTNNSWTHEMTMNEKFTVSGLDTADDSSDPPQVEEVGEATSE